MHMNSTPVPPPQKDRSEPTQHMLGAFDGDWRQSKTGRAEQGHSGAVSKWTILCDAKLSLAFAANGMASCAQIVEGITSMFEARAQAGAAGWGCWLADGKLPWCTIAALIAVAGLFTIGIVTMEWETDTHGVST